MGVDPATAQLFMQASAVFRANAYATPSLFPPSSLTLLYF